MTTTDHGPALDRLCDLGLLAVLRGTVPDRVREAAGVLGLALLAGLPLLLSGLRPGD